MKLTQTVIQKYFTVIYKGKTYYVDYLNSDGQILGLLNRDCWEILDEELEEIDVYENNKLINQLIKFCIRHFNDYKPDYKDC